MLEAKMVKMEVKQACKTHMCSKRLLEVSWGRCLDGVGAILEAQIHAKRMHWEGEHQGMN